MISSIHDEDPTYASDGLISLAVLYAVFAIANWLAPSIITVLSPKLSMVLSAVTYK